MKLIPLFTLLFVSTLAFSQKEIAPYVESITQKNLEKHVYTLASDSLEGRNTGKPGQKKAAEYIAYHFRTIGLDSLGLNNYYQPFDLYKFNCGSSGIMVQSAPRYIKRFRYSSLYGSKLFTHEMKYKDTLKLTYLGFGRDVKPVDLKKKVVVLILDENLGKTYQNIKQIAASTQARHFIVLFKKNGFFLYNAEKDVLKNIDKADKLRALDYRIHDKFLEKHLEEYSAYADSLRNFSQNEDTIFVQTAIKWGISRLFKGTSFKDLVKLEKKVAKGKTERNLEFINDSAICIINTKNHEKEKTETENVLAFIEGTDKKDEVIVVTAHYDHIGKRGKKIYYGADDNASGTAAIMEMAAAFQKAAEKGVRPRRSIMFVAFSGEEVGLRGSDFFVDNCPVPLDNVVLNLNLDMIGRNRNNDSAYDKTAYILSKGKHKRKYRRMGKRIARNNDKLILSTHPGFRDKTSWAFSSDHYRFKRKGIPFACFFTGTHSEYHTPKDTPDKINYPKLTEVTRVGYQLLWDISNEKRSLKVKIKHHKKKSFIEKSMD